MSNKGDHKTFVLCILDGWGHSKNTKSNAIYSAKTPFFDYATEKYPSAFLETSGNAVGLPDGQMGNSESGHITIGTGQIVQQDLVRINKAIAKKEFSDNSAFKKLIHNLKQQKSACHLMGLISDGGVHSHINHIIEIANELKKQNIKVFLHAITDGRDVNPHSAHKFVKILEEEHGIEIATLGGRYYAMDRDNRWGRTQKYYEAIVNASGYKFSKVSDAITNSYNAGISDEFIAPVAKEGFAGVKPQDCFVSANFRADRVRQTIESLFGQNFSKFNRDSIPKFLMGLGMVNYSNEIDKLINTIFPAIKIRNCLGSVISAKGWKQLRIAETEKYAHVTYFFNGGREDQYPLEERLLIPSPKVPSYDLAPQMSSSEVTSELIKAIRSNDYKFICVNFANADMVGHTGNFEATKLACQTIDNCLTKIYPIIKECGAEMLITADHGNAEQMLEENSNQPLTSHTTNKVPIIYIGNKDLKLKNGGLADIAPTIINMMNIQKPSEMTGKDLLNS